MTTVDDAHERIESTVDLGGLPKQLAPGLAWISACTTLRYEGEIVHSYGSIYVLSGDDASLVVDAGTPKDWTVIDRQLSVLEADGLPPVRYLVPTHTEVPHSGNLGRMGARFPEARVVGDVRDLHLFFPELEDRLDRARVGDRLDLGGRTFEFVEPVIRDLNTSLWGYDEQARALFTGDGFAYMHHHAPEECGLLAEQIPDLPLDEFVAIFAQFALFWIRHTDVRPHLERLDALLAAHPTQLIAPAHGSPIADVEAIVPRVKHGLLLESGTPSR